MRAVLCCREKGFGVVKKAGEPSSALGGGGVELTQEKLQLFVSLGKEEESDGGQDHLDHESWREDGDHPLDDRATSLLLHAIREEEDDDRDRCLVQPGIMSPSRNSTFLPSLFQSFCGSFWKQVRDPHASLVFTKKHRLGLLQPLKEGEGPIKLEPQREIQKEKGPSLWGFESGSPKASHSIRFHFFCKDESYSPIQDHYISNNTLNIRTENLSSGQINIICTCKIMERLETPGRWPYSPESNQLVFSVVGVPPSPLLKVDLLSQAVKEGDPLVFLCSTEGGTTEKKFHFYKDGVEITSSKEGLLEPSSEPTNLLQNASLRIPHASFNHSGGFACSYEEKRSNRWIMSPLSQGTNITVGPASVSQEQFQLREKKEERNDLPVMEPQAATADSSSPVKGSEVTYSCIQNFFTPSPPGPTRKNCLTQREEEGILYSDIVFPLKRRQQNHP
ncbi:hypothetical protein E2320_003702 [Naja naja]|nr:hypothetical protein E2320_003702 [Naja naja]